MREWTETRPSKLALAMTAGLRGHHDTSKLHCCDEASSQTTSPEGDELGFQQRIRLSLPQESSRSESCWHQATDSMPLWKMIVFKDISMKMQGNYTGGLTARLG